ncbi:DJ-1/PfpI family protein [Plantibacter sp. CFBP 13570]|uniref:DJ-1/PfpI family protein n=1 Tax=Plantibacter sp. CFBP 13570 TaxID=2775272 RepID=UPI001930B97D|nr:DJ-1/PfpI family protein [Plantibacter sp. CFBP 13570]MBD8534598.1 DJ-1/PfpI family protein [Plantibacter sp. CFBP 13570]
MHDDDQPLETTALPGHRVGHDPSASTLFTVIGDDPTKQQAVDRSIAAHHTLAARPGVSFATDKTILIVLHPGFELLDVVGPFHFLAGTGATVQFVTTATTLEPVPSGSGPTLAPALTLDQVTDAPAVILVPGGDTGILLRDTRAMANLERIGRNAEYVTSVCSGSIALAAAGLLDGRRATSHWSVRHLLGGYGAIEVDERVVEDGNRLTAAGVTAGMDLGIRLVSYLSGEELAKFAVLGAEHTPEPPFDTGTPERAGAELTDLSREFLAPLVVELTAPTV